MIVNKFIKYFWKQYLLYFVFLLCMFWFMGDYIYIFTYDYTAVHPYEYVSESNTYKIEKVVKIENENNFFELRNIENIINKYDEYDFFEGYATAVWCPGGVIYPEAGYIFQEMYYINPDADKVLNLDYVYGSWFDKESGVPEVILGNAWAEYYDAGDEIKVYFSSSDNSLLECDFKVAGVLDVNSCPRFSGMGREGTGSYEKQSDYSIYFSSFSFLDDKEFWYDVDLNSYSLKSICNLLVNTEDYNSLNQNFGQYEINKISDFFKEVDKELFLNKNVQKFFLFIILTVFGIIAITYSTSRKLNLLFYILSLNGMSRLRFILINAAQVFFVVLLSGVPMFVMQVISYRLAFENTMMRVCIMILIFLIIESVFVTMFIAVSRKRLQVLYKESLEN